MPTARRTAVPAPGSDIAAGYLAPMWGETAGARGGEGSEGRCPSSGARPASAATTRLCRAFRQRIIERARSLLASPGRVPEMGTIDFGLEGKTAVVTGATRGIGRGLAVRLADAGAQVAVAGRDRDALGEVVA
jgi:hypothetical protein